MKTKREVFRCNYFTVEELSSGVYAAFAAEEGGAASNSGIIDLGGKTVVFDTFLSADAARELRRFAERTAGRKVSYVINSHSHFDHIMGNCVYDSDTVIIATQSIYNELKAHENEIIGMKQDVPNIVCSLQAELQKEIDELSRKAIERDIRYFEMVGREDFGLRLPETTFNERMTLSGDSGKAVLLREMKGHTGSDIVLYLPEEKIAFMGDLLFTDTHPWLGAGDPAAWINTIHELGKYDAAMLVPGHGQTGTMYELLLIEGYIKAIDAAASDINAGRLKLEKLNSHILPEPYCFWKGGRLIQNLNFYSEYLKKL